MYKRLELKPKKAKRMDFIGSDFDMYCSNGCELPKDILENLSKVERLDYVTGVTAAVGSKNVKLVEQIHNFEVNRGSCINFEYNRWMWCNLSIAMHEYLYSVGYRMNSLQWTRALQQARIDRENKENLVGYLIENDKRLCGLN